MLLCADAVTLGGTYTLRYMMLVRAGDFISIPWWRATESRELWCKTTWFGRDGLDRYAMFFEMRAACVG
jgi:hypothetical protein